jgi:hypothetical protein
MRRAAHIRLLVATLAAALGGCYKPDILDGGYLCAEAGQLCPDGFTCLADHRCHHAGAKIDASMCTVPAVTPLCQDAPQTGQACNPSCQLGCMCGRCNVNGSGASVCTTVGAKTLGQTCTIGNGDDCGAGLICLREVCGNLLGRCYQHCSRDEQCGGRICQITVQDSAGSPTSFKACDLAPQTCNPVDNTGCPNPALNCYVSSSNETLCDCPNDPGQQGHTGDTCMFYNDCAPGFLCISNVGGLAGPHCHPVCDLNAPVCPTLNHCVSTGSSNYGVCSL